MSVCHKNQPSIGLVSISRDSQGWTGTNVSPLKNHRADVTVTTVDLLCCCALSHPLTGVVLPLCVLTGSASRRCMLDNNGVAFWGPPSFARCVSLEYRYLHLSVSSLRVPRLLLCQNAPRGAQPRPTSGSAR